MAESILFGLAESIVGSLTSAAVQEIASIWRAKDELAGLEETISTIKDVLLDAEEQQVHNHHVRSWLKKLEDAVYEADDLSDDISTEALRRQLMSGSNTIKKVHTFFSSSNQLVFRYKMAHKIKDIKERLDAISKNSKDFHLEVRREETRVVSRAREHTYSYIPEEKVIGRESDKIAILKLLLDPNVEESVSVVTIVGFGGLGKTALAQHVFNDEEVQTTFDLKMWASVSEPFDVKSLVERIIKSATDTNLEKLEMEQLQKKLREQINGKRYLLVLDDVWNKNREKWIELIDLLSNGAKGSKIMMTTREIGVAEITSTMEPYMLGILDKDNSWSLFKNVSFKPGQGPNNSNTERIAMEIMDKCGGIPLAIRTIGRLLYSKDPETEWSNFLEMEFSRIPQEDNDILPKLKLSYDNLPSNLKHCFAYCSLFLKDDVIDVDKLIKLWVAQGFIKSSNSVQSLEEVGNEYFKDLHWRSFFQEVKENIKTKKLECKMHDVMHDLAVQVAGTECATIHSIEENINERTRHVSCDFDLDSSGRFPTFLPRKNKIRTILLPMNPWRPNKLSWDDNNVSNCKLLRTLDLHGFGLKTVPNSIGKLKHLRYLDLSKNIDIKTLPNSITKLQNLQTLKLKDCNSLKELPRNLKKLVNLRHLENDGCHLTHMPSGMGQLTNLHTLNEFIVDYWGFHSTSSKHNEAASGLNELKELNNLKGKLSIRNLRFGREASIEYKDAKLKEKKHLHGLELRWRLTSPDDHHHDDVDALESLQPHPNLKELSLYKYRGVRLASWLPLLTRLDTLVLQQCDKIQNLLPLNQLPCLKSLELYGLSSLQYISDNVSSDLLASPTHLLSTLQSLHLEVLPNLKAWWKDDHDGVNGEEDDRSCCSPSFSCLSDLIIIGCPRLTSMPLYPHLKKGLRLDNSSLKTFQQTLMMSTAAANSSFSPLSNLTSITIRGIEDLESLPEGLTSLTSLKYLSIIRCPKLKYLSPAIQHLTSLQELEILGCQEADIYDSDGNMWPALKSLRTLVFMGLPQLETLPDGLQQLTSLQILRMRDCKNFVAIPEWIGNIQSLEQLGISDCNNLTSLPEGMRQLTSLQLLCIEHCPVLEQRCERETGEDWHKIAHIPHLSVGPLGTIHLFGSILWQDI